MDQVAIEIVYHLADLQYEWDEESGQRWPTLLGCQKSNILAFRSVCRAFREASWIPFRDLLAERIFYLNEEDLSVLSEIAQHSRLAPLVRALTFGSQVFTQNGLRILESGLENHPMHEQFLVGSGAWQRSLSSRANLPYDELVQFKDLYEKGLNRQELLWTSGDASAILSDCLYRLSSQNLISIRICPRPCHVTFQIKGKAKLSFSARNRVNHFVASGAVNHTRCNAWRNVDRTLTAIAGLEGRKLNLQDLRTSSMSNIRWSINSSIFSNTSLFSNLRTLQLSVREEELAADGAYVQRSSEESAHQLTKCLMSAPHLTTLDLEMCSMGEDTFASYALAYIASQDMPFRLQHLVLEYNVQCEDVLTSLIRPHARSLKRLLLLNSWVTEGTWDGWLASMKNMGVYVDYLEVWKPCEGANDRGISVEEAEKTFRLRDVNKVAREGHVACCMPQEQWDNCYPRFARR